MTNSVAGSQEIDESLRVARDAFEHAVARYRIGVFAVAFATTFVVHVIGHTSLIATTVFGLAVVYAIVVWAIQKQFGVREGIVLLTLAADCATMVSVFVLNARSGSESANAEAHFFVPYLLGPSLLGVLFINSLRNTVGTSIIGGLIAVVAFLATAISLEGINLALPAVTMTLVMFALVSVAVARRARDNLEMFARYQLLRRYLPPEAVERVLREDPDEAVSQGGRLVTVTLLSSDLRGFTAMSEKLTPRETMAQLNAYHATMIPVIERNGGAIDKFIGDGTLVVFGLNTDEREGARAAVACAKEMVAALELHNEARAASGGAPLKMGVGVHTGPVIAGNLGVPGHRLEFTVIGDAVNTASRLEGQTKMLGCEVIVSSDSVALLVGDHGLREIAPVSLRGKAGPMRVYGFSHSSSVQFDAGAELEARDLS